MYLKGRYVYHDFLDILNPRHREVSAHRLLAKMPTIAAWAYRYSRGQPFIYPKNDLSYTAGIGMRFDVNRDFGMQVSYNKTWIDFSKASGTPDFNAIRFDLLFRM